MKCIYSAVFIASLLISSFSGNAQGWKPANTPTGINQIRDMITFEGNLFISIDAVVYRSDDHGLSWEYVQVPYSQYYCFLVVQNGELFIISPRFVARSSNGFDWNFEQVATPGLDMLDVTSDGNTLWAATFMGLYSSADGVTWNQSDDFASEAFFRIAAEGSKLFASSMFEAGKLVFSTDGGQSWQSKNTVSPAPYHLTYSDGVLLATMDGGTWRSANDGDTWQKVREIGVFFLSGSTYYHIGNSAVSTSTDKGLTWSQTTSQLPPYWGQFAVILDNQLFLGANGGGIFTTSASDPAAWQQVNGELRTQQILDFEYHKGAMFMTATFRGVVSSDDEGETWIQRADVTLPPDITVMHLQSIGNDLFAIGNSSIVFRTTDGGQSWMDLGPVGSNVSINGIGYYKNTVVVAGSDGVYMSDDRGDHWTNSPDISGPIEWITSDNQHLYCGGPQGLMRYTESTQTWTPVAINGSNPYVYEIVFIGDVMFVQSELGILRSEDDGQTWTTVDDELSFFQFSARHSELYRNRESGLSQSLDSGETWQEIGGNHGLAIRFGFSAKHVFAAFNDRVWYRPVQEFAPPFVEADTTFTANEPLVITFDNEPYTLSGDLLTENDLDDLISIVDSDNNEVSYEATLSDDHLTITIVITDPELGESYTITVAPVQSASGIQSKGQKISIMAAEAIMGIGEAGDTNVVVYPNPFHNQLTISLGDTNAPIKSATIFDSTGKHVSNISSNGKSLSLDGIDLQPGLYFIKLLVRERIYLRKVVKK